MKPKFWLERWQNNQTGFHQAEHNKLLLTHWPSLQVSSDTPVFVPLCGKSLDMCWLAHQGHPVVGVELAQIAVETFFAQLDQDGHHLEVVDRFVKYSGCNIDVYHGDFFDLTAELVSHVGAIFDRGALVALPADMRFRYVDHLLRIVPDGCRMLLLTLEYDQNLVAGPPHAVHSEEVDALFGLRCEVEQLDAYVTSTLPPQFEQHGIRQAVESVYLITKQE